MLLTVKRSLPNKELHKIAKTIQWNYKSNLAYTYREAFGSITLISNSSEVTYKLRSAIEDSLNPSNKFHNLDEVTELLKSIKYGGGYEGRCIKFLTGFKLPSLTTIKADLKALMGNFNGINLSDDFLTVEMGPFSIEGVEFGNFQVGFHMSGFCLIGGQSVPRIYPVTPNYPDSEKLYSHPHVKGSEICLGEGRRLIWKAMTNARVLDCFEIVSSVLSTYNGKDPFMTLLRWTGMKCRSCHYHYRSDESVYCDRCERSYCKNCLKKCCEMSSLICNACNPVQYKCKYCGFRMCSECIEICTTCKKHLCSYHINKTGHRCV